MTKQAAMTRAEKGVRDAQRAIQWAGNRAGITEEEKQNLQQKLEYAQLVLGLVQQIEE